MQLYFFFNDTATTEIYTLSLHDALPIFDEPSRERIRGLGLDLIEVTTEEAERFALNLVSDGQTVTMTRGAPRLAAADRKSTRLNSSHANISYAVFCLKKKKP